MYIPIEDCSTVKGNLPKGWFTDNSGKVYLLKGNSLVDGYPTYEPYSEVIASIVAESLGLFHVTYTLAPANEFSKGIAHVSICEKYTVPSGYTKMTADEYMNFYYGKSVSYDKYLLLYTKTNAPIDDFIKMLIFDAVIGNTDRHVNNWDLAVTYEKTLSLPLIDNGSSLLADVPDNLIRNYSDIGPDWSKPFSKTHTKQISRIKNMFPDFHWRVDLNETWKNIYTGIGPILKFMPIQRAFIVRTYLYNKFFHYMNMFK